jgi:nitrogen fixation/metabolism regulation signal transduction histidine kinase
MQAASNLIVAIGLAALVILYVFELINTRRGGSPNLSQKLLRWQSVLQIAPVLFIFIVFTICG